MSYNIQIFLVSDTNPFFFFCHCVTSQYLWSHFQNCCAVAVPMSCFTRRAIYTLPSWLSICPLRVSVIWCPQFLPHVDLAVFFCCCYVFVCWSQSGTGVEEEKEEGGRTVASAQIKLLRPLQRHYLYFRLYFVSVKLSPLCNSTKLFYVKTRCKI